MNHASKRALSRYGMEMTPGEQSVIAAMIENRQGRRMSRNWTPDGKGAELWAVHWDRLGRFVPVIYLRNVGVIATVLPACVLDRGRRYRELDVDWLDLDADESIDTDALADVLVNALRSDVANDILAVKLKEALQHAR